jgi:hypothetical protein
VEFISPELPEGIDQIELTNLPVGNRSVDVRLRRVGNKNKDDAIIVDLLRADGDVEVRIGNAKTSHKSGG